MKSNFLFILHALSFVPTAFAKPEFVISGATWPAKNTGKHIQAHGAGITEVDRVYYMIGEDKLDGDIFRSVSCYSSTNLVDWKYENALLSRTAEDGDLGSNRTVHRPKVIYNDKTKTYVMYMHINIPEVYSEAKVGIATSDSVCGNYTYHGSFRPLDHESRDIGLFKDDDGSAYLLTEDQKHGLWIVGLTDDYLNVTKPIYLWPGNEKREAPAIIKKNGYYFMFGSGLTYWEPNDNDYSYAKALSGPWSSWKNFADPGTKTYRSQTSFILPFGDSAIYMGDRWHKRNLGTSTYTWLPLEFKGTAENPEVSMPYRYIWALDLISKTWSGTETTVLEPQDATLSNGARLENCEGCSHRTSAGYLGGPQGGVVTFSGGLGKACEKTTILMVYVNGDDTSRFASVTVNGEKQKVEFPPSSDGQQISNVVIYGKLHSGSDNNIVVEGVDGRWAANIDKIILACTI